MPNSLTIDRYSLALPLLVSAIQCLVFGQYLGELPPMPTWGKGGSFGAYPMGLLCSQRAARFL